MAKQLTYIQIIKNMVESYLHDYIMNRCEHWANVSEINLARFDDRLIAWTAIVKVNHWAYEIHGIMNEYGRIDISSISYDRTRSDSEEWWKPENQYQVHEFLYGDKLEAFAFDK